MIPELAGASAKQTLEPWKFGGVGSYPKPMIDLSAARDKTLQVWKIIKKPRVLLTLEKLDGHLGPLADIALHMN